VFERQPLAFEVNRGQSAGAVRLFNTANNSATDTTTLVASGDLGITKTATDNTLSPGEPVQYTIVVTNSGPSDVVDATVADTFSSDLTDVTWTAFTGAPAATDFDAAGSGNINDGGIVLPVGSSVTYVVDATISPFASGATIDNTATVGLPEDETDPNAANNSDLETITLASLADLSITKTDNATGATPGGSITYTIVVSNGGPAGVLAATVVDYFPADLSGVTYTAGSVTGASGFTPAGSGDIDDTVNLPPGSSITYVATATINPSATADLVNTATVTSPAGVADPDSSNNTATTETTVAPSPNVSGTKSVTSPEPHVTGAQVQYTIVLTNSSVTTQPDNPEKEFIDVLPAGLTLVNATASSGTPTATIATNTVTWNGTIAQGAPVTITITATIVAPGGTVITNAGTIFYDPNFHGANDASRSTDDPRVGGASNPTDFAVAAFAENIPVGGPLGMALMVTLLALSGLLFMRKG
jgi:uncharacterized repeat protein (TIGR01451 family)